MSANKYLRFETVYQCSGAKIIMTRIPSYMHHEHGHPATFEGLVMWIVHTDILTVTVPVNTDKRFECCNFLRSMKPSSEIPGVPDLIHRFKEFLELF